MSNERAEYDFSGVLDECVDEFHRQAELLLDNTLKIGLAADSRATTSSNIFGAAAIASFAVAANLSNSAHPHVGLLFAIIAGGCNLGIASGLSALSARPDKFFVTGYEPIRLYPATADLKDLKRNSAEDLQVKIENNVASLARKASYLYWGQNIAALAPLSFVVTFSYLHHYAL